MKKRGREGAIKEKRQMRKAVKMKGERSRDRISGDPELPL